MSRGASTVARLLHVAHWSALLIALLVGSLHVSWQALAAVDFGYSLWYEVLDIDGTIATHGPRNPVRPGFERTDRAERMRLFSAIVDAIHDDGSGLDGILYHDPQGRVIGRLLTPPERVHLEDVARLVGLLERAGSVALAVLLLLAAAALLRRESPPAGRRLAVAAGLALTVGTALVLVIGPVTVFYALHELVFPPEHEWFFWYEESLMSMLMQAPNLFGPIAVVWLLMTLGLGVAGYAGLMRALRRRAVDAP